MYCCTLIQLVNISSLVQDINTYLLVYAVVSCAVSVIYHLLIFVSILMESLDFKRTKEDLNKQQKSPFHTEKAWPLSCLAFTLPLFVHTQECHLIQYASVAEPKEP